MLLYHCTCGGGAPIIATTMPSFSNAGRWAPLQRAYLPIYSPSANRSLILLFFPSSTHTHTHNSAAHLRIAKLALCHFHLFFILTLSCIHCLFCFSFDIKQHSSLCLRRWYIHLAPRTFPRFPFPDLGFPVTTTPPTTIITTLLHPALDSNPYTFLPSTSLTNLSTIPLS
ncbi:hypothetical protein HD806DRAFT_490029 [Xylariaceae sp. AK1471]|nr:hypothetical protein HD806DRAFT_490029 [Xylariaceae sp. AK1471]